MHKVRWCSTVPVVHSEMEVDMETVGVVVLVPGQCKNCLFFNVECSSLIKELGKDCTTQTIFKLVPMEELCQS